MSVSFDSDSIGPLPTDWLRNGSDVSLAAKLPVLAPVSPSALEVDAVNAEALQATTTKILQIIDRYRLRESPESTAEANESALECSALIYSHVNAGRDEPWPQSKTNFGAINVTIDGHSEAESARICHAINETLNDGRVAYYHAWEKGDMVISDNILLLHTRSKFQAGCGRELWRINLID